MTRSKFVISVFRFVVGGSLVARVSPHNVFQAKRKQLTGLVALLTTRASPSLAESISYPAYQLSDPVARQQFGGKKGSLHFLC